VARGAILSGEGEGLLAQIGPDVIGVGARARVEVLEAVDRRVRMRLHTGRIALKVQHRTHDETVEIEARDLVVRVVGTRFTVSVTPQGEVQVGVQEGRVRVTAPAVEAEA
jgi:ferric-dicitrate binding protein FerR (iron transport regulator)